MYRQDVRGIEDRDCGGSSGAVKTIKINGGVITIQRKMKRVDNITRYRWYIATREHSARDLQVT